MARKGFDGGVMDHSASWIWLPSKINFSESNDATFLSALNKYLTIQKKNLYPFFYMTVIFNS